MPNLYPFLSLRLELVESGHPPVMAFPGGNTTASSAINPRRPLEIRGPGYRGYMQWLYFSVGLWPAGTTFAIITDKVLHGKVATGETPFALSDNIRRDAVCGALTPGNTIADLIVACASPLDIVHLTADPLPGISEYAISRKPSGGEYVIIAEAAQVDLRDGPLHDGDYVYKATAYDQWGNGTDSNEEPVTVTTVPEPVTDLAFSYEELAGPIYRLTVTWTESASSDIDHYAIYLSGDDGVLEFDGDITDTTTGTSWEYEFAAGITGTFGVMVRAVDATEMERGIFNVEYFALSGSSLLCLANEPAAISAGQSVHEGKAQVTFTYDARDEIGIAVEARFFSNSTPGGPIDWLEPVDTMPIEHRNEPTARQWISAALAPGEHIFGVRMGTDVYPNGFETLNIDDYPVTISAPPSTPPDLGADVV